MPCTHGERRPAGRAGPAYIDGPMPDPITHKPTADCSITSPHDPELCGIVRARRARAAEMQALIERQLEDERSRAGRPPS